MQFAGAVPPDAPDPRLEWIERVKAMPIPLHGFVPQPHLEDWGAIGGGTTTTSQHGVEELHAVIGYTLWRHPEDRSDPANLADLDDDTRAALEATPPWPRPQWILDAVERMRYPMLGEAVRTTWRRSGVDDATVEHTLVDHANHILRNRFREELGLGDRPWADADRGFEITGPQVQRGFAVEIGGRIVDGMLIDTDPFVYAVGAPLGPNGILTAVVPGDELSYLTMAFAEHPLH